MKAARITFIGLSLILLASAAWATTVPNYLAIAQQTEKWFKSEGAGKLATLRMHTLVQGAFMGATILERDIILNGTVIESEQLLFTKDVNGNILYYGTMEEYFIDTPIRYVKSPLTVGDTWTDSRPEVPCCGDPENMVHYVFAVLDTKAITCPAGVFDCHRVFMSVVYPDGSTETETYWYNPHCGLVMFALENSRVFELQKAIIPGVGTWGDINYHEDADGSSSLSGLKASPNPLNPKTDISFDLGSRLPVQLRVYDVSGKLVRTLVAGEVMDAGTRSVVWNGKDDRGSPVASGTYIYRLQAGRNVSTNRMTLIR
ncbi:MAG: FlgD immunoglobulin-like domain containing protein [Candidatus Krumholzibacteriota bacterium]